MHTRIVGALIELANHRCREFSKVDATYLELSGLFAESSQSQN